MNPYIEKIRKIKTVDDAVTHLQQYITIDKDIQKAIEFAQQAHSGQSRKSGEPYVVHPILVAAITAMFLGDKAMVITALLHDVVEDTEVTLDFVQKHYGEDIARLVDGLTKIVEIREHELTPSSSSEKLVTSALTFRKMLLASIDDVRVLVIKLCDRLHNMITLSALPKEKIKRISEETIVVYAPIAHRLGMSTLKNYLEDLSFYYIYPNEYQKIDDYIHKNQHQIQIIFNQFIAKTKDIIEASGYSHNDFKILSRIKHHYSIFLKMQRKGVNIDEVLDLLAIRILVKSELDCYKILGLIHLKYKPLIARFKDYVSTPKENGYQTLHSTVFYDAKIYEVQIRTFDMHRIAEYGIAAHWAYKSGKSTLVSSPNLKWLHSLEFANDNIEEFYHDAKEHLFGEDIVVYSPKGDTFNLPRGSTAFDFAYKVHSDVGNCAIQCYINKVKRPLLSELKSSDIVSIKTANHPIPRCTWIDMVKTNRAKKSIKLLCSNRVKEIDELTGKNIINTIFSRYNRNVLDTHKVQALHKVPNILDYTKHLKKKIEKEIRNKKGLVARLRMKTLTLKVQKFDNIIINSNFNIGSVLFDHCCHPKFGDAIVAIKNNNKAIIHHKLCEHAFSKIKNGSQMVYCGWVQDELSHYKVVVSIPNLKGELAKLLTYLSSYDINVNFIEYGKDKVSHIQYCEIEFETSQKDREKVRHILEKKVKVIEFVSKDDAYK